MIKQTVNPYIEDLSKSFREAFLDDFPTHPDLTEKACVFIEDCPECPNFFWSRDERDLYLRKVLYGFLHKVEEGHFKNRVYQFLKPDIWAYGSKGEHLVPHIRHFNNIYFSTPKTFELVHIASLHCNIVLIDDDGEEVLPYRSFLFKIVIDLSHRYIRGLIAKQFRHEVLLNPSDVSLLLQEGMGKDVTQCLFPRLSSELTNVNLHLALAQALSRETTPLAMPIENSQIPAEILNCSAGFRKKIESAPPLPSLEVLNKNFFEDVRRLHYVFKNDLFPEPTEHKEEWLYLSLIERCKNSNPDHCKRLLSWLLQGTDHDILGLYQDPEGKRCLTSSWKTGFSALFLLLEETGVFTCTIVKTNYSLTNINENTKQKGFVTMVRTATFSQTAEEVNYEVNLITHAKVLTREELPFLFVDRRELDAREVLFKNTQEFPFEDALRLDYDVIEDKDLACDESQELDPDSLLGRLSSIKEATTLEEAPSLAEAVSPDPEIIQGVDESPPELNDESIFYRVWRMFWRSIYGE